MEREHLFFQQKSVMREENLVQTQERRAQSRGSSSSLAKMLRTMSSVNAENNGMVAVEVAVEVVSERSGDSGYQSIFRLTL